MIIWLTPWVCERICSPSDDTSWVESSWLGVQFNSVKPGATKIPLESIPGHRDSDNKHKRISLNTNSSQTQGKLKCLLYFPFSMEVIPFYLQKKCGVTIGCQKTPKDHLQQLLLIISIKKQLNFKKIYPRPSLFQQEQHGIGHDFWEVGHSLNCSGVFTRLAVWPECCPTT